MDIPSLPDSLKMMREKRKSEVRTLKLPNPPIIEAVLDIECDMPPAFKLETMEEAARKLFGNGYPKFQTQLVQRHRIHQTANTPPKVSTFRGLQSLQLLSSDRKQLVQVRTRGFSFNRLAPYSTLDDYIPEIERTWGLFLKLAAPMQVRDLRLRYINRILLPLIDGKIDLDDFLRIGPRLPAQEKLMLSGFLNQYTATETGSTNRVKSVLTTQPVENGKLPLLFDIQTSRPMKTQPDAWKVLLAAIASLRSLKNQIFEDTLTNRCLNLFQT